MPTAPEDPRRLAPLQQVMLADSFTGRHPGAHVEQVVIVFGLEIEGQAVVSAWEKTVEEIESLKIEFVFDGDRPAGWRFAEPSCFLRIETLAPGCPEAWLEEDRECPLLVPDDVPWRAVWWPGTRRFVWTFHHALLDGRSIASVIRHLLGNLHGRAGEKLGIPGWSDPSAEMIGIASRHFSGIFSGLEAADIRAPRAQVEEDPAIRSLGKDFKEALEARAVSWDVTAGTLLILAWGQAVAEASGADPVVVEQVRSGPPRPGTAGFAMNLLPVLVRKFTEGDEAGDIRAVRRQLLDLRKIETVSAGDLLPGLLPTLDGPWNSVIMIEHGTLRHMVEKEGAFPLVESIELHEHKGTTLAAATYLAPDFLLKVEGPAKELLLGRWIANLERLAGRKAAG